MSKPNLLAIWAKHERGEGATNEELGHLIERFESLHDHAEQAEQAVARVREVADNARATKHESTEYLHPLKILRALDGHTKQLGGTPTGEFAYVCSCGKSYWPCTALDGEKG